MTHRALIVVLLGIMAFPLYAADWTKEVKDRAKRTALHDREQRVRGDSGKWMDNPRLQHAPPIAQKPAKMALDTWADSLLKDKVAVTDKDDNWLIFRPKQLDDNDRVWVQRIERRGQQFTVVAKQAKWKGKYFRNFTYYPVIGLNLGKLEAGKYQVKWIIQPHIFSKLAGEGKSRINWWPKDERPSGRKPAELQLDFTVTRSR